MSDNRYSKINTQIATSRWVRKMSDGAKFAWVCLINHAKAHGVGGCVKSMDAEGFAHQYFLSESSVEEAISDALHDNALLCDGDVWVITNWETHQGDSTGADRQKRHREKKKGGAQVQSEEKRNDSNALRNASNTEERRGEEKRREEVPNGTARTASKIDLSPAWEFPGPWRENEEIRLEIARIEASRSPSIRQISRDEVVLLAEQMEANSIGAEGLLKVLRSASARTWKKVSDQAVVRIWREQSTAASPLLIPGPPPVPMTESALAEAEWQVTR